MSIVILTWQSSGDLLRCIRSLERNPSSLTLELVVVDNGSDPAHADRLKRGLDGRARLVRSPENLGVAGGRNLGLDVATGDFLAILDDDCVVEGDPFATLVDYLKEQPSVGLVGPSILGFDGKLQFSCRRIPGVRSMIFNRPPLSWARPDHPEVRRYLMADVSHERVMDVDYVLGACQVLRRQVWEDLRPLDEGIFYGPEDADWCLRVRAGGWAVRYVPQARVTHHYRRIAAANIFSRHQRAQLRGLARFFYRNRHLLAQYAPEQNPMGWLPW